MDPRPDLAVDSALWSALLTKAFAVDGERRDGLFGALDGFRGQGARLVSASAGGVRLRPGEISDAEYAAWKAEWLEPHRPALLRLLGEVQG